MRHPLTQQTSGWLAFCAILVALGLPSVAKSDELFPSPGCADEWLQKSQRCTPYEAVSCAMAWACAETNNGEAVAYAACTEKVTASVTKIKRGQQSIDQGLAGAGYVPEEFWQQYGVRPQALARCANAYKKTLSADGFWNALTTGDDIDASCHPSVLWPQALAEFENIFASID